MHTMSLSSNSTDTPESINSFLLEDVPFCAPEKISQIPYNVLSDRNDFLRKLAQKLNEALGAVKKIFQILFNALSRLDTFSRELAKKLHESGYLYALYGALDGLSNAYSSWKYIFDILYTNTSIDSTDALHNWMLTWEGMLLVSFETIVLIAYSTMGNYFDDESQNILKSWIAQSWPYVRDCIKGTKNAFKGLRASMQVASVLSGISPMHLLVPISLVTGFFAVANRLLLRQMYNQRKNMMRNNKSILISLQNNTISVTDADTLHLKLEQQTRFARKIAYLGAAFGGLVDGMYMYIGVLGMAVSAVSLPMLIFLASCSMLYLAACITTRLYEEYFYQKRVDISVTKVELALAVTMADKYLQKYTRLCNQIAQNRISENDSEQIKIQKQLLKQSISDQLAEFSKIHKKLIAQQSISWKTAFLMGIRHGLSAYGALTSCMFAAATIMVLFSVALPPSVLIAVVSTGLVLMGIFLLHAFYNAHKYRQKSQQLDSDTQQTIDSLTNTIEDHQKIIKELKPDELQTKLFGYMEVDPSPQFFFQEWFEVVRSFFSGIGKGSKSIDYTMVAYQEMGEDGHYHHDNVFILCLTGVSSFIFALCLSLRALCKGFGRPPVDEVKNPAKTSGQKTTPVNESYSSHLPSTTSHVKLQEKRKSENNKSKQTVHATSISVHSFFNKKQPQPTKKLNVSSTLFSPPSTDSVHPQFQHVSCSQ